MHRLPRLLLTSLILGGLSLAAPLPQAAFAADHAEHAHDAHAHEGDGHDGHDHVAGHDGFRVIHAWTRATRAPSAEVFMELENHREQPVQLLGAALSGAQTGAQGSVVGFTLEDGTETWVALPQMPVPAGQDLALTPHGVAVRIDGLSAPLVQGEHLALDLLTSLGPIAVHVEIEAAGATASRHAGHSH